MFVPNVAFGIAIQTLLKYQFRALAIFFLQGGNAEFSLENDGQVFEVFPTEVQGEANVLLRIVDSSALDFETTKSLTVKVEIT